MRKTISKVDHAHPDFPILSALHDEITRRAGGRTALQVKFPSLVREAVDFVLDPVRTARTRVSDLDNVEKTFIGLKVEHFFRDMIDVPKRVRDLEINGVDVDVKNTVGSNWSIPQETYGRSEPCVLISIDDKSYTCSLGLIVARIGYLHGGRGNRDTKRGVSKTGFENILWLLRNCPFAPSRFSGLDMDRFRELRGQFQGNERAAQFWRENIGRVVHRNVMEALLFDQRDPMKRLRANGGAPDILQSEGIAVIIGTYLHERQLAAELGIAQLKTDEIVGVAPRNRREWQLMRACGVITSEWID